MFRFKKLNKKEANTQHLIFQRIHILLNIQKMTKIPADQHTEKYVSLQTKYWSYTYCWKVCTYII